MSACTCRLNPGRFEGETPLTVLGYWYANNGLADETYGDVDFFKSPLGFTADKGARLMCLALGYCEVCIDSDLEEAAGLSGLMIWQDDQGFVFRREITTDDSYDRLTLAYAKEEEEQPL